MSNLKKDWKKNKFLLSSIKSNLNKKNILNYILSIFILFNYIKIYNLYLNVF
jgi:hypothetical protein